MKRMCSLLLPVLLLAACLSGCGGQQQQGIQLPADLDLSEPFVGFLSDIPTAVDLGAYERLEPDTFDSYQSENAAYGTDLYFKTLPEAAQWLYRVFQYAMDHGKASIYIDSRLLQNLGAELDDVLLFLALDNAMLEQNLSWGRQDVSVSYSGPQASVLEAVILNVEDFSQAKLDKKQQALDKARQIVSDMDESLTDAEKAEYFYRYLGTHTEYFSAYGDDRRPDYLYDALLTGKTNCDGFANAYALLCSLAGIECAEKMYTPEKADEIGHTWNMICLDGTWYNVDATGSQEVNGEYGILSHFCVADDRMEYTYSYSDRLPACNENLEKPDCILTDAEDAGAAVKKAYDTVRNTDRKYILVYFTDGQPDGDTMQDIANALNASITTTYYVTNDGTAVYYIFPEQ